MDDPTGYYLQSMSRSRKKCGVIKDNGRSKKYDKRLANKAVRHADLSSGCSYKKVYDQYNICDYWCSDFREPRIKWWDDEKEYQAYLRRLYNK